MERPPAERFASFAEAGIDAPAYGQGEVKMLCPRCSHRRKKSRERCLSVNLGKGVWNCHNDDCRWRGYLSRPGERTPFGERPRHTLVVTHQPLPDGIHPAALSWFAERGISPAVLRANDIRATEREVLFPYTVGGQRINTKYRAYPAKKHRMDAGCSKPFWNVDRVGDSETLTITEGEFDVLAIQEATGDVAVISVPNGCNSDLDEAFDHAGDLFERVKRVILAGDSDEAGQGLTDELARRIGREKCSRPSWPGDCKDANEVLVAWGPDVLADCLLNASPYPVDGMIRFGSLLDDVLALRKRGARHGYDVGYPQFSELYRPDLGQMSIVSGVPGSGKSTFLDNIMVHLIKKYGWKFAVCSPENDPPALYAANLIQIATGRTIYEGISVNGSPVPKPLSDTEIERALMEVLDRHITLINPDPMSLDDVLSLAGTVVQRDGAKGVILDPWNRLGHGKRGSKNMGEYVTEELAKVKQFTGRRGVHTWVVAHPTKIGRFFDKKSGQFVSPRVRPYDISDSHAWADMADMIFIVHRDQELNETSVYVDKVRFRTHGKLGSGRFRFEKDSGRFVEL